MAGSRQRHDLQVFVTHHGSENVEEALARAWSRSQAKSLALDLVDPADRNAAMDAARDDVAALTPEALLARAEELRAKREMARQAAASVPNHELARIAELRTGVVRAEQGERDAEERAARLGDRLDRIPVWRRGERAEVRAGIAGAERDAGRQQAHGSRAREELALLGPSVERALGVERARATARDLGAELAAVEVRLDAWAGREPAQALPPLDRSHGRPGIERHRGRDR